jgi:WD40 repeat protein
LHFSFTHKLFLWQDINSIAVSPNDKLIATGSQDKTAKVRGVVHFPRSNHGYSQINPQLFFFSDMASF